MTVNEARYVEPDSALARVANELYGRHTAGADGVCGGCEQPSPCPSARNAAEVRLAAGLTGTGPNLGAFTERVPSTSANQPAPARFTPTDAPQLRLTKD